MRTFDLIVIGSGSGNSIVDERFADWDVALIDDGARFGGTCTGTTSGAAGGNTVTYASGATIPGGAPGAGTA